jgi:hypothetical protein
MTMMITTTGGTVMITNIMTRMRRNLNTTQASTPNRSGKTTKTELSFYSVKCRVKALPPSNMITNLINSHHTR